jgi:peptidoglycan/xylan/chitin deacetylase (PgdA/CDA1 family)
MLLHGAGAAALAVQPDAWAAVLGVLAANHGVLALGMHPRATMLGPNITRLPPAAGRAVALTFDDGPDPEVTPRVLDMLEAHGARATFFVIGQRALRHPALLREIARRGHGIGNHTHRHPVGFAAWGPWRQRREIVAAQRAIADAGGTPPRLFRAPMGLRNPLLDPVLAAEDLRLVSWTRRGYDAVRRDPEGVLARLSRGLGPGDILLLHDAVRARDAAGVPVVLSVLPRLLERITAAGLGAVTLEEACGAAAGPGAAAAPAFPAPGACA